MNDVSNRAVREFSEFLNSIEADFPKPTCTTAYEITMKSTIVSALITLDTEKQMDERFWNHLRVQRNILDFLYALWLDDDRTFLNCHKYSALRFAIGIRSIHFKRMNGRC